MKQVLKLTLALVVMVAFAAGVMAQTADRKNMSKDEKMKMKMERMKSELSLTDEQTAKIQEIYNKHFNADDRSASKEDWKNKREAVQNEVKAVLTADQVRKLEAMQAERKAKMKERHDNKDKGVKNKGEERRKNTQEKRQDLPTK